MAELTRKEKIRRSLLALWSDNSYRARVTKAIRESRGLPEMTKVQFYRYKKLRRTGVSREIALIVVMEMRGTK